jgi:antitoxin CcdA
MPAAKRRTNVTVGGDLLDAARELGLNVSAIADSALAAAVRKARAEAWEAENRAAIAQRRAWIEEQGPPLADWQVWKPE